MHRFGTLLQFCAVGPDITVCVVWSPVDTALPLLGLPPTDKHSNVYHCLLLMCIGIYLCTVNRLMDKTCVMFRIFVNFSVSQLLRLLPSTSCLKIQSFFFFSACYELRWSWSTDGLGILSDNKKVVAGDGSNRNQAINRKESLQEDQSKAVFWGGVLIVFLNTVILHSQPMANCDGFARILYCCDVNDFFLFLFCIAG